MAICELADATTTALEMNPSSDVIALSSANARPPASYRRSGDARHRSWGSACLYYPALVAAPDLAAGSIARHCRW
jgi:hypothetical protein